MTTINFFRIDADHAYGIDPVKYHFCEADVKNGEIVKNSVREYLTKDCISVEEALSMPVLAAFSCRIRPAWHFMPSDLVDIDDSLYANYD